MKKLDGKIAVITGGNSGIGLATAQRFVDEDAYVFVKCTEDMTRYQNKWLRYNNIFCTLLLFFHNILDVYALNIFTVLSLPSRADLC
jgi:short subunit dehydrogenase